MTIYSQYVEKVPEAHANRHVVNVKAKIFGVGDSLPYQNHDPRNDCEVTL